MLTDKLGGRITGSDLLAGILDLVPDNDRIAGKEKLHTLFHQLRRHYTILSEFNGFATHWPQVWSERLDESFRILGLSRIIMQDGEFHAFGVTKSASKYVKDEILPRFGTEQILQAREIADIISKSIVCHCNLCETIKKSPNM